jgi:hypothetical protein
MRVVMDELTCTSRHLIYDGERIEAEIYDTLAACEAALANRA